MNGGTEEKEGRKGREIRKKRKERMNCEEPGGFGDSWYCCLLAITVS